MRRPAFIAAILAALSAYYSPEVQILVDRYLPALSQILESETNSENCGSKYLGGQAPTIPVRQAENAILLCYSAFASLSSPVTRTPLWAAEKLTAQSVKKARKQDRVSEFHPEKRLPAKARAELADYRRSGWDRGHLAPSGDMPTLSAQQESFSLANIVPQAPDLNRGKWADMESKIRSYAQKHNSVYVVTGILYQGKTIKWTPTRRVAIPTAMWKAVATTNKGAIVYVAANQNKAVLTEQTVQQFTAKTGIDPFPALGTLDRRRLLKVHR